ncbi:DUF6732 family protein [Aliiroseovarius sp. F20344]|uniref:DUF6732 family protein n=1 Tax=Aliiroseovarius sp. F20344 TaxID=2926414 RepID=UPI001FF481E8|nr:DUF6732 family protein [Aliiroseovarius sp. F20344]MCK0140960.1 hypothetical protein [Aliiroseovarius sp. F20344]
MTRLALVLLGLLAGPAIAHPSHIGEVAGHDHIGAIILIGLAAGIGLWAALKGRKDDEAKVEETEVDETDKEPQEA